MVMKTPEQMAEEYANTTDSCHVDQEYAFAYNGFLAGYQAAKPQWISVKDMLPEEGFENVIVLVWRASWHDYDTVRWKSCGFDDVNPETITHWMPLPNAPKEEK